jgi:hypothetical protein
MAVCTEEDPPEVWFGPSRVACHLYPPGSTGEQVPVPITAPVGAAAP